MADESLRPGRRGLPRSPREVPPGVGSRPPGREVLLASGKSPFVDAFERVAGARPLLALPLPPALKIRVEAQHVRPSVLVACMEQQSAVGRVGIPALGVVLDTR